MSGSTCNFIILGIKYFLDKILLAWIVFIFLHVLLKNLMPETQHKLNRW